MYFWLGLRGCQYNNCFLSEDNIFDGLTYQCFTKQKKKTQCFNILKVTCNFFPSISTAVRTMLTMPITTANY